MFKFTSACTLGLAAAIPTDVSLLSTGTGVNINKITQLISEIKGQVEKEQLTLDKEHKQMECYATAFDQEFGELQKQAAAQLEAAEATITEKTALIAELNVRIETTEKSIADNDDSIEEARTQKEKQLEELNTAETEYAETIKALEAALVVLNGPQANLLSVMTSVKKVLVKNHKAVPKAFEPTLALLSGGQAPNSGYQRQSGQITGILTQMLDEFKVDLDENAKEKKKCIQDFDALMSNYQDTGDVLNEQLMSSKIALEDATSALGAAETAKKEAEAALSITGIQLQQTQDKIEQSRAEYSERSKMMATEIQALGNALELITSDDFQKAMDAAGVGSSLVQTSFLQIGADRNRKNRMKKAAAVLRKNGHPALLHLAASMKAGARSGARNHLDLILEACEKYIAELKTTMEQEQEMFDEGVAKINEMQTAIQGQEHLIERNAAKVDAAESEIATLQTDQKNLIVKIQENVDLMEKADKLHTEEVENLNAEISADKKAIEMLNKVANVLDQVFDGKATKQHDGEAALMQIRSVSTEDPEYRMEGSAVVETTKTEAIDAEESTTGILDKMEKINAHEFTPRKAVTDVPTLIREIAAESAQEQAVAKAALENKKSEYADLKEQHEKTKDVLDDELTNNKVELSSKQTSLLDSKENLDTNKKELMGYEEQLNDLHGTYDFIIKWGKERKKNYMQEIEDINQAKALLAGADFGEAE